MNINLSYFTYNSQIKSSNICLKIEILRPI